LQLLGVRIETLADGAVSEIHVGLKGTMCALFFKDLAQKTRRGQIGRVKAGRIPGGRSYAYDVLNDGDDRGRRAINAAEADIVRRIFREYATGKGPLAIVRDLNREPALARPNNRKAASARQAPAGLAGAAGPAGGLIIEISVGPVSSCNACAPTICEMDEAGRERRLARSINAISPAGSRRWRPTSARAWRIRTWRHERSAPAAAHISRLLSRPSKSHPRDVLWLVITIRTKRGRRAAPQNVPAEAPCRTAQWRRTRGRGQRTPALRLFSRLSVYSSTFP
jgi:hypothetical protein